MMSTTPKPLPSATIDKERFLEALLTVDDPLVPGKKIVKGLGKDTIQWDVARGRLAPWRTTSKILRDGEYMITFPTDPIVTTKDPTTRMAYVVALLLNDADLKQNRVRSSVTLSSLKPKVPPKIEDTFMLVHRIDPTTGVVTWDQESGRTMMDRGSAHYDTYGVYPAILGGFMWWLKELLNQTVKSRPGVVPGPVMPAPTPISTSTRLVAPTSTPTPTPTPTPKSAGPTTLPTPTPKSAGPTTTPTPTPKSVGPTVGPTTMPTPIPTVPAVSLVPVDVVPVTMVPATVVPATMMPATAIPLSDAVTDTVGGGRDYKQLYHKYKSKYVTLRNTLTEGDW